MTVRRGIFGSGDTTVFHYVVCPGGVESVPVSDRCSRRGRAGFAECSCSRARGPASG